MCAAVQPLCCRYCVPLLAATGRGRGVGWGGYGVGDCTMDPGLGQKRVPSLKNTTNWATDFLVNSKQGKGRKVVG